LYRQNTIEIVCLALFNFEVHAWLGRVQPGHAVFPTTMAKDYRQLWKDVTNTSDEGKAVRTLAEILLDKEGRSFISNLERKDAELMYRDFGPRKS
jgi:hypothetical protein